MIDLAVLQFSTTATPDPQPLADTTATTLRTIFDGGLTIGAVWGAYRVGRRALMGHFLPDEWDGELPDATTDRDLRALAVAAVAYLAGVGLTSAAVALLASFAWALAWAGSLVIIAAVVALSAARDASPVDDVRLLAEARRNE